MRQAAVAEAETVRDGELLLLRRRPLSSESRRGAVLVLQKLFVQRGGVRLEVVDHVVGRPRRGRKDHDVRRELVCHI